MKVVRVMLALSVVLVATVIVVAQQGPPPGPGGFGPPGGGGFFIGGPGNMLGNMLRMPEVQTELALKDDQKKAIDTWQTDQQTKMQENMQSINFAELQDLEPEAREKVFADIQAKNNELNRKGDESLGKLLDEKQFARLRQLRLQREGLPALARQDIADKLKLTDAQLAKIDDLVSQNGPMFGGPPPAENPEAMAKAIAVLTDEQKTKWQELTGKEFKFVTLQQGGRGGRGGPGGGFGPGGMMGGQETKLVAEFDKDKSGWLNSAERVAARESLKNRGGGGRGGPGGRGGFPGGMRGGGEAGKPGPKVSPSEVEPIKDKPLYDENVVRTLFFDFENKDWETELSDFHNTDVDVAATMMVDGKEYKNVGLKFRGMSSYMGVAAGSKRSLNVSIDMADPKQRLYGYKTLNLLNAHEDSTFMHTVIYSHIARKYIPAPKANFVRVVINGESWGLYTNAQQFDKIFVSENYPAASKEKPARWKVRGSPGGDGGLRYLGENVEEYKRRYEIKSDDSPAAWQALIKLCKTLNETPSDKLEEALKPMLDIDGVLWFLALDNALINSDGYWVRASDYCIVLDAQGIFHIVPHDMNETFQTAMGPGMGGFGPGGGGRGGRGGPGGGGPGGEGGPGGGRGGRGGPGGFGPGGDVGPLGFAPPPGGDVFIQQPGRGEGGRGGPGGEGGRGQGGGRGGPGGGMGGGGGFTLDPLVGLTDNGKPLRSKLLQVPSLRAKYLANVKKIAEESLDPKEFVPLVTGYRKLIEKEVEADTRKLSSFTAFQQSTAEPTATAPGGGRNVLNFALERRNFLLKYQDPNVAKVEK